MKKLLSLALASALATTACAQAPLPFTSTPVAEFNEPWALEFLPDGRVLVTEKSGTLQLVTQDGKKTTIIGTPKVDYIRQGGLGDIALHPQFATNKVIYLSFAEAGPNETRGVAVAKGTLNLEKAAIENLQVIWQALPKVDGGLHFSQRLLFDKQGNLFVSAGERNKFDPAQDLNQNLGKIHRLNDDGTPAAGNPFAAQGGIAAQIYSLGHRNPLGLAFDKDGQLWNIEMGPRGGDELNRVIAGANFGYPLLSNGNHYDGKDIPDHSTDTSGKYQAPKAFWNPVISPSSVMFYSGSQFPQWQGNAFISGLSSQAIVRLTIDYQAGTASEAQRIEMGKRVRGVEQGPDGNIWAIEDGKGGRLLKLSPLK